MDGAVILRFALLAAAAFATGDAALACTYPVREHPILAARAPDPAAPEATVVRFAVDEALVLALRGQAPYTAWSRIVLGVRGTTVDPAGAQNGQPVEVLGRISLVCFMPADSYELTDDGRLIVWVSGTVVENDGRLRVTLPQQPDRRSVDMDAFAWTRIRWGQAE